SGLHLGHRDELRRSVRAEMIARDLLWSHVQHEYGCARGYKHEEGFRTDITHQGARSQGSQTGTKPIRHQDNGAQANTPLGFDIVIGKGNTDRIQRELQYSE